MITPQVAQLIAAERSAELQRKAVTARLARLARLAASCRPSRWARAARRVGGPAAGLYSALRRDRVGPATCCAGA